MIRHPVENLRRRHSVTQQLFPEIVRNGSTPQAHANLLCRSAFKEWLSGAP
jgi:hypothetical protein